MHDKYPWAQNINKLGRALLEITDEVKSGKVKQEDFEAAVKERYVKFLGVVIDIEQKDRTQPAAEDAEAPRTRRGRKPAAENVE